MSEERGDNQNGQVKARGPRVLPRLNREQVEDLERTLQEERRERIRAVLVVLAIVLVVFLIARSVRANRQYSDYTILWEEENVGSQEASYQVFASQILKVTGEGISGLSTGGETLWSYGMSMVNPKVALNREYGAVVDVQSEAAVIFNTEGVCGTVSTNLPILGFTISAHGVLALELDEGEVNYINFYDSSGKTLDIRIKTLLSGDGFPLDFSLSPTGTGLLASMVYLDQGSMQNRLVFYNFDVGKVDSDRTVGEFIYGSTMFPEVSYMGDRAAVAFGDDQVNFYSLRNESSPSLVKSVSYDDELYSVFFNEERAGVVSSGENGRLLTVYDTAGKEIFHKDITLDYTNVEFSGNYTLLYNSSECLIYTDRGQVRYQGALGGPIRKLVMTGDNHFLMFSGTSMKRIRLK